MGKVEYKLPDDLGTLTFGVPTHWVGGRANGVDALWIDQDGSTFKDNVVLKIRPVQKVADAEQLLDLYLDELAASVEVTPVLEAKTAPGRRSVSFESTVSGQNITQNMLVIYSESGEKSYLLALTNSHLSNTGSIDLSPVTIN